MTRNGGGDASGDTSFSSALRQPIVDSPRPRREAISAVGELGEEKKLGKFRSHQDYKGLNGKSLIITRIKCTAILISEF
jgi:hypothetical protein